MDVVEREDGKWFLGRYELALDEKQALDKIARDVGHKDCTAFVNLGLSMGYLLETVSEGGTLDIVRRNASGKIDGIFRLHGGTDAKKPNV